MTTDTSSAHDLKRISDEFKDLAQLDGLSESALHELEVKYRIRLQIAEQALKDRELRLKEAASSIEKWANPLLVGIIAGAIGLLANALNGLYSNLNEKTKLQNDLIKEAIKPPDVADRARSLLFFARARLIAPLDEAVVSDLMSYAGTAPLVPGSTGLEWVDARRAPAASSEFTYSGICDASAAEALDDNHFVVASDEANVLQIYRYGTALPVAQADVAGPLGVSGEVDIEGAASKGKRIYWISSHGTVRGRDVPDRQRFFATETRAGQPPKLDVVGRPYTTLLRDMRAQAALAKYGLDRADVKIEGLAASPDGSLLIGFREPLFGGKALLLPLLNPDKVLQGSPPVFGTMIELDLGGRGISSIEGVEHGYYIAARAPKRTVLGDGEQPRMLFTWTGQPGDRPQPQARPKGDLVPEAVFFDRAHGLVHILSDDGGSKKAGQACKRLPDSQRTFRSVSVSIGTR